MKICYILNKSIVSGPNIVALSNIKSLCELGVEVSVVFLKGDKSIFKFAPFLSEVKCHFINKGFLQSFFVIRKILSKNKIKVVHSHCFFPDLFNILIPFSDKKIATIHNIPSEDYLIRYGALKGRVLLFAHLFIMKRMTINICVSKTVSHLLPLKNSKKSVIYNPVRECFFSSRKKKNKFTIIYCGHFSRLKNPLSIIELVKSFEFDFEFIGLGDGEMLVECKNLVVYDKRFVFPGRVNNVEDYFSGAHCLVHFSKTEGFCLSVAEALVSDMYVIVNELPIFKEVGDLLSENRILSVDSNHSLYESLLYVLYSYEKSCEMECIREIFSEKKSAEKHLHLYNTLMVNCRD